MKQKKKKDKTYQAEGMLLGLAIGSIISGFASGYTDKNNAILIMMACILLGMTIGSNIKNKK